MNEAISSRKNEKITRMRKLGSFRAARREFGEFLCDGEKLLLEALKNGADIRMILTADELRVKVPENIPIYSVPMGVIEAVSPLKNPQSILFSCAIPKKRGEIRRGAHIILENMQDPGNVGMVMRTANAFLMADVILVGSCADPYNPKAVRASMGAVFRQRVYEAGYEDIEKLRRSGLRLYGAALGEGSVDIRKVDLKNTAVVIGSEGQGLSEKMLSICDGRVIVPMNPACESLNAGVAAAVVMWEMRRAAI
ncbi:MAG: TrmH family RNA methyltransferase [Oscillospiraceae bacterium]